MEEGSIKSDMQANNHKEKLLHIMTKILGDYQVIHAKSNQWFYFVAEDDTEASSTDPGFSNYWLMLKI